jgi:hypothetical protein
MILKRHYVGAIGVVALVFALALAGTAKTEKRECFTDTECTLIVGGLGAETLTLTSWGEAPRLYGHYEVYAGANNTSVLDGSSLHTSYAEVDDLYAFGSITANSKSFRIDHPSDPANRILNHWSVESDDLKNIYDGVVKLDANGAASVKLPAWFESLNGDFRYQLTAVGGPGANLYVADEISKGQFKIAGGTPSLRVSWQVTGIRHDPSSRLNRKPVEEEKVGQDRGKYLRPAAFGQPESMRAEDGRPAKPVPPASAPVAKPAATKTISSISPPSGLRKAAVPIGATGLLMSLGSVLAFRRARKPR